MNSREPYIKFLCEIEKNTPLTARNRPVAAPNKVEIFF